MGALIGYAILFCFFHDTVFGIIFVAIAGIMVFIALDELLSTAREHVQPHLSFYGLIAGAIVMALGLFMFL